MSTVRVLTPAETRSIVEPDRLLIDCRYVGSPGADEIPCPSESAHFTPGATFHLWYRAFSGEESVVVEQTQELRGWQDVEPVQRRDHENVVAPLGPGRYGARTARGPLSGEYSVALR